MNLYNEIYSQVLSSSQQKYKKLHNLYMLKALRNKVNCFKQHHNKADQYYDCFFQVEGTMLKQSQQFVSNCDQIDDEYKICLADCKENFKADATKKQGCFDDCNAKFKNSIGFLYQNFYQTNLGKEPEYKSAKKP